MEERNPVSKKRLLFSIIGVALMLLLLFLLKPYIVSVADFRGPVCAAIVPKDETDLLGVLRSISFKEGWLYLAIYNKEEDIPHLIDKVHATIQPKCVVVAVHKNVQYTIYDGEKVFIVPDEERVLLKFIYQRGEHGENLPR
ncbi:hypothetical protein GM182_04545 [bacterium 3DAC]|nr:hypothetical protein GM182_04545 [bacterium 3DAC]